jgi:hypothetical protein
MIDNSSEQPTPRNRRRFLQFNLRTVLIVVTLGCLIGGVYMRPILQQRADDARLKGYQAKWAKLGGRVNENASRDEEVTRLDLAYSQATTLPLEIGQLSNLAELYLNKNQLTELPPEIGQLSKLRMLGLYGNQLTEIPPEIGNLKKLEGLRLESNPITDADLEYLTALKSLGSLRITRTNVTKEGVAELKKALPNCVMRSDF